MTEIDIEIPTLPEQMIEAQLESGSLIRVGVTLLLLAIIGLALTQPPIVLSVVLCAPVFIAWLLLLCDPNPGIRKVMTRSILYIRLRPKRQSRWRMS